MKAQKNIAKPIFSDAFLSKNADGDYLSNDCFYARCRNDLSFIFTGKERDEETGYGYFGVRYMDHELMTTWLSVDPMSDKYPSISPYAYCAWNPVKLVDPNGCEIDDYYNLKGDLVYKTESGDNKYLILTDESKSDNPNSYLSVAVPSMKTLSKMESMYDNVKKNEQGIVLGTDGNSSSIVNVIGMKLHHSSGNQP